MRLLQIKCLFLFVIGSAIQSDTQSQSLAFDTTASPAVRNAIAFYSTSFNEQLHLYNGPQYRDYIFPFTQGQPYFVQAEFSLGEVCYDGNRYSNVSILYNLVSDDLIILSHNKVLKIQLLKEKVAAFSLHGHSFIHMAGDSLARYRMSPGFYDMLVNGKVQLLAKRVKVIEEYPKQVLERHVMVKDQYYLRVDTSFHKIDSKSSMLKHLAGKKKEIQNYVRQQKFNFKKDRENTMLWMVSYYNLLNRQ